MKKILILRFSSDLFIVKFLSFKAIWQQVIKKDVPDLSDTPFFLRWIPIGLILVLELCLVLLDELLLDVVGHQFV